VKSRDGLSTKYLARKGEICHRIAFWRSGSSDEFRLLYMT
jgi:hypothetical protein